MFCSATKGDPIKFNLAVRQKFEAPGNRANHDWGSLSCQLRCDDTHKSQKCTCVTAGILVWKTRRGLCRCRDCIYCRLIEASDLIKYLVFKSGILYTCLRIVDTSSIRVHESYAAVSLRLGCCSTNSSWEIGHNALHLLQEPGKWKKCEQMTWKGPVHSQCKAILCLLCK